MSERTAALETIAAENRELQNVAAKHRAENQRLREALQKAYTELNIIRARDGMSTPLWSGAEWNRLQHIEEKARAVIAAGRPHGQTAPPFCSRSGEYCPCPQCAAWDALKALLEPA